MNLPTNAIALLGERICTKMLPQRDEWSSAATDMGDIVTEEDTRQAQRPAGVEIVPAFHSKSKGSQT